MKALEALRYIVEQSGCGPKAIGRMIEQPTSAVRAALDGPSAPPLDQIIAIANALGYELALVDAREVLAYDACFLTRGAQRRYRKGRKRVRSFEGPLAFDSDSIDLAACVAAQAKMASSKPGKKGGKKAKGAKARGVKVAAKDASKGKGAASAADAPVEASTRSHSSALADIAPATSNAAPAEAVRDGEVSVRISDARPNPHDLTYRPSVALDPQRVPHDLASGPTQHYSMKEPKASQAAGPIPNILMPDEPMPPMPDISGMCDMPDMAAAMPSMPMAAVPSAPMQSVPAVGNVPFPPPLLPSMR